MKTLNQRIKNSVLVITILFLMGCNKPSTTNSDIVVEETKKEVVAEEETNQFSIGKIAPDFSLTSLQNENTKLNDLKGNIVVIHFATTWCPFCNAEAPTLEQLYQDYKNRGVNVLIIDVKEPPELVQEKLQDKFNFSFPVLLDLDGLIAASYCPPKVQPDLPRDEVMIASNLIIDSDGKIIFFSLLDSKEFDANLTELKNRLDELLVSN